MCSIDRSIPNRFASDFSETWIFVVTTFAHLSEFCRFRCLLDSEEQLVGQAKIGGLEAGYSEVRMEVLSVSRTLVGSGNLKNSSICKARSSSSFLGFTGGFLFSLPLKRREGRSAIRAPSALLNSHEYRKQKLEKVFLKEMGSDIESDNDEDLCPIECVREISKLSELEHVIEDSKSSGALVVVDFFRTSCGSCRYIERGFQKLCKGAGDGEASVVFLKHNVRHLSRDLFYEPI